MQADRGLCAPSRGGEELDGDILTPKGWAEVGLAGPPHFFLFFGLICIGRTLY
jgi:hypothetical protein